jgi:hypothetical protein
MQCRFKAAECTANPALLYSVWTEALSCGLNLHACNMPAVTMTTLFTEARLNNLPQHPA